MSYRTTRHHPTKGERTLDAQYYPLGGDEPEAPHADAIDVGDTAVDRSDDQGGVVAVLRDVTDRENRSRQLRAVDRVLQHNIRNDLNAIEHSDRATPDVTLAVDARGDRVLVRVSDDGPGISKMDRDVVETGATTEALYHGSGLGLWVVYWIARRSGGSVTAEDAEPRGTRATMSLPAYYEPDRRAERAVRAGRRLANGRRAGRRRAGR